MTVNNCSVTDLSKQWMKHGQLLTLCIPGTMKGSNSVMLSFNFLFTPEVRMSCIM